MTISKYYFLTTALCKENDIRLLVGNKESFFFTGNPLSVELINDDLSKGRVEICHNGTYRTLCADASAGWDNRDAMVVCRELGFSPFGKICKIICHYIFKGISYSTYSIIFKESRFNYTEITCNVSVKKFSMVNCLMLFYVLA